MPGIQTRTIDDETAFGSGPGVDAQDTRKNTSLEELLTGDPKSVAIETTPEIYALLSDETSMTGSEPIPETVPPAVEPHGYPITGEMAWGDPEMN